MPLKKATLTLTVLLLLVGCATVKYDRTPIGAEGKYDPAQTDEDYGFPFYEASPHLLVVYGRDSKGNRTTSASLISLPDRRYQYKGRVTKGLGNASLELTLANGVATSTSASAESTDSLAGLLTALSTAALVPGQADKLAAEVSVLLDGIAEDSGIAGDGPEDKSPCKKSGTTWCEEMRWVASHLSEAKATELTSWAEKWYTAVATDKNINWTHEPPIAAPLATQLFHAAVKVHLASATKLGSDLVTYYGHSGCAESGEDDCRQLRAAAKRLKHLIASLSSVLPEEDQTTWELYAVEYSNGEVSGLELVKISAAEE